MACFLLCKVEWTEKCIECQAMIAVKWYPTLHPTAYSSEGDQMCPTQGRLNQFHWGGSRSPVTRTRPPIPPVKYHPVRGHWNSAILRYSEMLVENLPIWTCLTSVWRSHRGDPIGILLRFLACENPWLYLVFLVQCWLLIDGRTDRQTDRHMKTTYTALA